VKPSEFVILTAVLASGIYTMLAKSGLAFFHITLIAVLAAIVFRMSAIHWRWHEIMPGGGSFVYFIFSFIDCLSSSPITGTKDPDHLSTVSKPYGPDAAARFPKTVVALLRFTVLKVFRDNAAAGPQKPTAQARMQHHASTGFDDSFPDPNRSESP
jgi:hypothetical protein